MHVAVDGTVWGPQTSDYQQVSQTPVSGSGTSSDPYRVVTVACAGNSTNCNAGTAPLVTQTVTYVPGRDYYRTDVRVQERSGSAKPAVIYQYADCYLQDSDSGYGFYDSSSGGIYCSKTPNNSPADRIEGFVPLNSGSSYYEAGYSTVRNAMDSDGLPNMCECTHEPALDNGMGLGYAVNLPAGGEVTRSFLVAFSPTGNAVDVVAPDVSLDLAGQRQHHHGPHAHPLGRRRLTAGRLRHRDGERLPRVERVGRRSANDPRHAIRRLLERRLGQPCQRHLHGAGHSVDSEGNTGTSAPVTFTVTDPPAPPGPPPGDIDGFLTPPPPKLGEKVNVAPVAGTVLVKLPGTSKFISLTDAEQIPVGTTIDTKRGSVRLTSAADASGRTQAGTFRQGVFVVKQARGRAPITQLTLTGTENFRKCPRATSRTRAKRSASRPKRRLWGNAKGRFSTKGRYAAATVRGTEWYTEDNCSGTLVKVRKGVVTVRDLRKRKNVTVKAGRSYLAKAK